MRLLFLGSVLLASSAATGAQYECKKSTSNEWLKTGSAKATSTKVASEFVRAVTFQLPTAIAMLENTSAVQLTDQQAVAFTGEKRPASAAGLRPFLVRAVFTSPNQMLEISWNGDNLLVFAGGLGCDPFVKHPIVVFLDRKPKQVFVAASEAL